MAQYRNVTDETLFVVTDSGLVKVESDSVVTVSDAYAESVYFQTGDTGETALWELVAKASSTSKKSPSSQPADPADG